MDRLLRWPHVCFSKLRACANALSQRLSGDVVEVVRVGIAAQWLGFDYGGDPVATCWRILGKKFVICERLETLRLSVDQFVKFYFKML